MSKFHATTILGIRHSGKVVMAGDGQVTFDDLIMKHTAQKVRLLAEEQVLAGFAGTAADAFTLFEKFETKLDEYNNNLPRAAVELAKEWRSDKFLRQLEALLVVMDWKNAYIISGTGDVIEPDDGLVAIGSGGPFAYAAAKALALHAKMSARQIAEEAMKIAASLCVYTNDHLTIKELKEK